MGLVTLDTRPRVADRGRVFLSIFLTRVPAEIKTMATPVTVNISRHSGKADLKSNFAKMDSTAKKVMRRVRHDICPFHGGPPVWACQKSDGRTCSLPNHPRGAQQCRKRYRHVVLGSSLPY